LRRSGVGCCRREEEERRRGREVRRESRGELKRGRRFGGFELKES